MTESKEMEDVGRKEVTVDIPVTVLPDFGDQLDEYGKADLDMRFDMGKATDSETGDTVANIFIGMSGKIWVEYDEDVHNGQRVTLDLDGIMQAAHNAVSAVEEDD